MNKIIQILSLFRTYGLGAVRILFSILVGRPVQVNINGRWFTQNLDKSTVYHLLNSYSKVGELANAIPSRKEGVIIDGGANNGLFSFLVKNRFPQAVIHAFEPSPALLPFLQKNLDKEGIRIHAKALSMQTGELSFFYSPDADQIGSLEKESVEEFEKREGKIFSRKVPAISLDSFLQEEKIDKIWVLKLDVQGAEYSILKGAQNALEKTDYLLVEVMLIEPTSFELLDFIRAKFPYHKVINSVSFGADILFAKTPF